MKFDSTFDLFTGVIGVYIDYLRKNTKLRFLLFLCFTFLILLTSLLRVYSNSIFYQPTIKNTNDVLSVLIILFSILLIFTSVAYSKIVFSSGKIGIDLDSIRTESEELKRKLSEKQDDVFNTIQLSLNQLKEYYAINLSQAKSSYNWSIAAIIIGIITLIVGIWFFYFNVNPNISLAIISGISSVIIEFIGASNIYIYNKSLKQLNIYFKELINIQDTMLAIELSESIEDIEKKISIKEKIIFSLISRSSKRVEFLDD